MHKRRGIMTDYPQSVPITKLK